MAKQIDKQKRLRCAIYTRKVEASVEDHIRHALRTPEIAARTARALKAEGTALSAAQVREALDGFDALWADLFPAEQARIARLLIERVIAGPQGLTVHLRDQGIARIVTEITSPTKPQRSAA